MMFRILAVLLTFAAPAFAEPIKYILDTDLASDCDDAGAVAVANVLADKGEAEILAMMISTGGNYGAPALCAINTWYGRGDVPIGTVKDPAFWVGGSPEQPSGWKNYESYNRWLAENCPTKLKTGTDAPDATVLYRQILAKQPDGSVVINTIGPLINVAKLLQSKPDAASPLDGSALIKAKVKLLVITGGRNPKGTSSNFSKENAEEFTKPVIEQWPSPVVFVGNEVAIEMKTGWTKNVEANKDNPARLAYKQFFKGDEKKERASSDQAGVLFAIRGVGEFFTLHDQGHQSCDKDGNTVWLPEPKDGLKHAYLIKKPDSDKTINETLQDLMVAGRKTPTTTAPADPKAAIMDVADKWLAAYLTGDLDALLAVSQRVDGEQREKVDAILEAVRERNNLVAAIYAAFPAAEANHWPDDPVETTLAEARESLAKATVKIDGDIATMAVKNSSISARLTRQPDGRWLFDTFQALTGRGRVRNVLVEERADSQTCRELTPRVKAGDFTAVQQIRARYTIRLNQLTDAAATQPANK